MAERRQRQVTIVLDGIPPRSLHDEARRRGWELLVVWYCGSMVLPWMNCQGALVSALPDSELVRDLRAKGGKIVRLGNFPHPLDNELPAVLPDHHACGRAAAEHFHERQFHDVGYVGRDPWSSMLPLYEGFSQRAEALGMNCHLLRFKSKAPVKNEPSGEKYLRRQKEFAEWLEGVPKPVGLLAHGEYAAAELCFMVTQAGLEVPVDVAILGGNYKQGMCETATPPVSSFANDEATRVHVACELLARLLEGDPPPREPIMVAPPGIVERQSTNVLAVSDPVVARALRFIWDHFNEPLTVNDVAEGVAVSRGKLDRLFSRHLSRGVKTEINRKRLEMCRHLLKSTDFSMSQIAAACGFHNPEYMCEVFHKTFGVSPRDYRTGRRV